MRVLYKGNQIAIIERNYEAIIIYARHLIDPEESRCYRCSFNMEPYEPYEVCCRIDESELYSYPCNVIGLRYLTQGWTVGIMRLSLFSVSAIKRDSRI